MAFITTADIAANLPVGFDSNEVDRLLLSAEADLVRMGLVFNDSPASAFKIPVEHVERSVFSITPTRTITLVRIGCEGSNSFRVVTDYTTSQHANITGYTTQIELIHDRLIDLDYLEVTGKRGIYINFTDLDSYETNLLRTGLIAWIRSQLSIKKGQSLTLQGITSAGTGESKVAYGVMAQSGTISNWGLLDDPDFTSVKYWFKGL